jgi:hypothetical protein
VQTIHEPQGEARQHYARMQEGARKDVERCFGILQARFAIIQNPCRQWNLDTIDDILKACAILHNMVIEDEAALKLEDVIGKSRTHARMQRGLSFDSYVVRIQEIEDQETYFKLRQDLIAHLWAKKGESYISM